MGRKPVLRTLPSLETLFPSFQGFDPATHQAAALAERLRAVAGRLRQPQARPFYAMRDLARFFAVSVPTVAAAYRELERAGILVRVRSSRTLLTGRRPRSRLDVRGVVGLPTWLAGFATLQDWQSFFVALEEQLRRCRFVADFVFYYGNDFREPEFAERLLAHQLDWLLWFLPLPLSLPVMQSIADHGVRIVVVTDGSFAWPFPAYALDLGPALLAAFHGWKRDGLATVEIVGDKTDDLFNVAHRRLLQAGLAPVAIEPPQHDRARFVGRLGREPKSAVLIVSDLLRLTLCSAAPQAMSNLVRRCRLLVLRGGLDLPAPLLEGLKVDLVDQDWPQTVRQIVRDIDGDRLPTPGTPVVLPARWWPRTEAMRRSQIL